VLCGVFEELMSTPGAALSRSAIPGTASADVLLGRSVDNLFDANDSAVAPQTAGTITPSLDSVLTTSLSRSPAVSVTDAVSMLTRPHRYADRAGLDARRVPDHTLLLYYSTLQCGKIG